MVRLWFAVPQSRSGSSIQTQSLTWMVDEPAGAARMKKVQWRRWSRRVRVRGQDFFEAQVGVKVTRAPTLVCSLASPRPGLVVEG